MRDLSSCWLNRINILPLTKKVGVFETPTFFVNGRMLMRFSQQELRSLIDEELKN